MSTENRTERPECPTIECSKCGTEHHYDARGGRCRECSGYLPEATQEQHEQFGRFLEWNAGLSDDSSRKGDN